METSDFQRSRFQIQFTEVAAMFLPMSLPSSASSSFANSTVNSIHSSTLSFSSNSSINVTSPPFYLTRDESLAKVEMTVLGVIFVTAVLGNGIVFYVLASLARHKKLSRMNSMIFHLTIADLFVGLFQVLPQLAWKATFQFRGGQFMCKMVTYGQLVATFAASYVLVTTAIDRYLAICHPLDIQTWGRRRMRGLIAAAWIISFLFAIPQMLIFNYGPHFRATYLDDCIGEFEPKWTLPVYITWITLSIYLVPLLILVVLYTKICLTVWRSASLKESSDREVLESPLMQPSRTDGQRYVKPRAHVRIVSQAKVKTVKLTLVVIANYFFCYGPFFISQMWAAWDEYAPFEDKAMVIIMLLASLTSCTNPWIYLAFNDRYALILSKCFKRIQQRSAKPSTSDSASYTMSSHVQSICTTRRGHTSTAIRMPVTMNSEMTTTVITTPATTETEGTWTSYTTSVEGMLNPLDGVQNLPEGLRNTLEGISNPLEGLSNSEAESVTRF